MFELAVPEPSQQFCLPLFHPQQVFIAVLLLRWVTIYPFDKIRTEGQPFCLAHIDTLEVTDIVTKFNALPLLFLIRRTVRDWQREVEYIGRLILFDGF